MLMALCSMIINRDESGQDAKAIMLESMESHDRASCHDAVGGKKVSKVVSLCGVSL